MNNGRVIQGVMFIVASASLFFVNFANDSLLGMTASTLFFAGNVLGLYLYIKKHQ
jgi:hypothetical protein